MPVEMPLAFEQTSLQHPSPVNNRSNIKRREDEQDEGEDEDEDSVQLIDFSGSRTQGASELEKAIGVHAVDQETLERDIALEVLKLKYPT